MIMSANQSHILIVSDIALMIDADLNSTRDRAEKCNMLMMRMVPAS